MKLQNPTIPHHVSKLGIVRNEIKFRQRGKMRFLLTRDNNEDNRILCTGTAAAVSTFWKYYPATNRTDRGSPRYTVPA